MDMFIWFKTLRCMAAFKKMNGKVWKIMLTVFNQSCNSFNYDEKT